jgi:hypothetical protein
MGAVVVVVAVVAARLALVRVGARQERPAGRKNCRRVPAPTSHVRRVRPAFDWEREGG